MRTTIRTLKVSDLHAICAHASGMCHRYTVDDGARRVRVTYSNPDEWASDHPVTVAYPKLDADTVALVMCGRVTGGQDADDRDACADHIACLLDGYEMEWSASERAWHVVDAPHIVALRERREVAP